MERQVPKCVSCESPNVVKGSNTCSPECSEEHDRNPRVRVLCVSCGKAYRVAGKLYCDSDMCRGTYETLRHCAVCTRMWVPTRRSVCGSDCEKIINSPITKCIVCKVKNSYPGDKVCTVWCRRKLPLEERDDLCKVCLKRQRRAASVACSKSCGKKLTPSQIENLCGPCGVSEVIPCLGACSYECKAKLPPPPPANPCDYCGKKEKLPGRKTCSPQCCMALDTLFTSRFRVPSAPGTIAESPPADTAPPGPSASGTVEDLSSAGTKTPVLNPDDLCVICGDDRKYPGSRTCKRACQNTLDAIIFAQGIEDPCVLCKKRPKYQGYETCGRTCRDKLRAIRRPIA